MKRKNDKQNTPEKKQPAQKKQKIVKKANKKYKNQQQQQQGQQCDTPLGIQQSSSTTTQTSGKNIVVKVLDESERQKCPKIWTEEKHEKFGFKNPKKFMEDYLWPMSVEDFMKNIYRQKAYAVVNSQNLSRAKDISSKFLFDLDYASIISSSASENIHVQFTDIPEEGQAKKDGRIEKQLESFKLERDNALPAALLCHQSGKAGLYFRSPPEMESVFVTLVSRAVGMNFGCIYPTGENKGEIEVFMSKKGHVTDWHFDYMENFTIQLKGSKTWKMMPSNISHPLRGCTPHFKTLDTYEQQMKVHKLHDPNFQFTPDNFDLAEEVTLTEGSILYHPGGYWHKVECTEDSVSVNISLVCSNYADVVSNAVHHLLLRKEEWRANLCFDSPDVARNQLQNLLNNLKTEINKLTVDDILPHSIFLPRYRTIQFNEDDDDDDDDDLQIDDVNTAFRINPLAALVRLQPNTPTTDANKKCVADCNSNSNTDCKDKKCHSATAVGSDSDMGKNGCGSDSDESDESDSSSSEEDEDRDKISFAVHVNLGNEDLTSLVRIVLKFPMHFTSMLDWIAKQPFEKKGSEKGVSHTFTASEALQHSRSQAVQRHTEGNSEVTEGQVQKVFALLRSNGFLVRS